MPTTQHHTSLDLSPATSPAVPVPSAIDRDSEIPSWVGTRECQSQIIPGITIFREGNQAILRIIKGDGAHPKEFVEFEVDPSAICKTFDQEQLLATKWESDFCASSLAKSQIFRQLAADLNGRFKVRSLHLEDSHVEFEALLAEGAKVSGSLADSFVSFRGAGATFENFTVAGASRLHMDCLYVSFNNVTVSSSTDFCGNITGLSIIGGGNSIQAHATELIVADVARSTSAAALRQSFKGSRISANSFNLALFDESGLLRWSVADVIQDQSQLNQAFYAAHLSNLPRYADDRAGIPLVLSHDGVSALQAFHKPSSAGIAIEFDLNYGGEPDRSVKPATLLLSVPPPSEGTPHLSLIASAKRPDGESVEGAVRFQELGSHLPLLHHWFWYALQFSRGNTLSPAQIAMLVAQSRAQILQVV